MSSGLSRRSMLQAAGITTALAATGFSLSACSTSGDTGTDIGSKGKTLTPYPTYVPSTIAPAADLPGTAEGVQAGYLKYPEPQDGGIEKPGDGSKITVWTSSWSAIPLPKAKNKFWQELEKALGVELDITVVPAGEYNKKLATLQASGQMPDVMQMVSTPNEAQFVLAKCQDLSDFVSGDNIKKYPNLAAIPTYAWEAVGRFAGKLYGIPVERPVSGHRLIVNQAKFKEAGLLVPEVGGIGVDQFTAGLKQLSGKGHWALGAMKDGAFGFNTWMPAFGTPGMWSVKDGAFSYYLETDEFQAGLEQMVKWQQAGIYRSNALTIDGLTANAEFESQKVYAVANSSIAFTSAGANPKLSFEIDSALPFKPSNGASPTHWLGSGVYGYTAIKKAPKERVELILRVLNYLAAPFGTKEYELVHYGVEGTHFTRNADGDPIKTDLANTQGGGRDSLGVQYLADAPQPLYVPGNPEVAKREHAFQQKVLPIGVTNASDGLRTSAWTSIQESLMQHREDAIKDIVMGRKKLSDWPAVLKEFERRGGKKAAEALAEEYEAAQKA
ncbi:extracellular solute-binding protein [Streptomyces formicae]|uniref:Extracellular solute-binding protein n=1 Tax=Streptomyces formicae TaxID=1616117 RepID=A0ABY3WJN1_9ACTN|nr:extracellular solute-binding protein [Streptomyces formicae]UNM12812.1 extracellular solute-binding protein [Streptomyces formicae]